MKNSLGSADSCRAGMHTDVGASVQHHVRSGCTIFSGICAINKFIPGKRIFATVDYLLVRQW